MKIVNIISLISLINIHVCCDVGSFMDVENYINSLNHTIFPSSNWSSFVMLYFLLSVDIKWCLVNVIQEFLSFIWDNRDLKTYCFMYILISFFFPLREYQTNNFLFWIFIHRVKWIISLLSLVSILSLSACIYLWYYFKLFADEISWKRHIEI